MKQNLPKLNKGIFNLLYNRHKIPVPEIHRLLKNYAADVLYLKKPKKQPLKWYAKISEEANKDFEQFSLWFKENKNNYDARYDYEDWYNEAALDGSLAYNGAADDF